MSPLTVLDAPPKVVRRKGAPMKTPKPAKSKPPAQPMRKGVSTKPVTPVKPASLPTKSTPPPKQRTKKVPKKKT